MPKEMICTSARAGNRQDLYNGVRLTVGLLDITAILEQKNLTTSATSRNWQDMLGLSFITSANFWSSLEYVVSSTINYSLLEMVSNVTVPLRFVCRLELLCSETRP